MCMWQGPAEDNLGCHSLEHHLPPLKQDLLQHLEFTALSLGVLAVFTSLWLGIQGQATATDDVPWVWGMEFRLSCFQGKHCTS